MRHLTSLGPGENASFKNKNGLSYVRLGGNLKTLSFLCLGIGENPGVVKNHK
jgi:hypothetical protein